MTYQLYKAVSLFFSKCLLIWRRQAKTVIHLSFFWSNIKTLCTCFIQIATFIIFICLNQVAASKSFLSVLIKIVPIVTFIFFIGCTRVRVRIMITLVGLCQLYQKRLSLRLIRMFLATWNIYVTTLLPPYIIIFLVKLYERLT